jgi:phospholipid-binding lipoprotein MlaA
MMRIPKIQLSFLLATLALSGCASTGHNPKDPFESFNRGIYQFNDALDEAVVKPVAKGYNMVVPVPGRMMLSNFFSNLNDVIVAVNDLLQFKVVQAVSDTGRIAVNTTVGFYGLADVATMVGLKKHNEDFGQTLGYWGVGSGPYIVLPLLGPSSVRDSIGEYADSRTSLMRKIKHVDTRNEAYEMSLLVRRAARLDQENVLDEAAIDRYAFIRDAYLQHRQSQVYDGNPPREKFDDEEDDSKPDRRSSNDKMEDAQSLSAETSTVAAPAVAVAGEPSTPQQTPVVQRVWLSQDAGVR